MCAYSSRNSVQLPELHLIGYKEHHSLLWLAINKQGVLLGVLSSSASLPILIYLYIYFFI